MRVAVTGAAGFLGRALVDALSRDERVAEIVALDRTPFAGAGPKARAVTRDTSDPRVADDLQGARALVDLAFRDHDLHGDVDANVAAARNVFKAAIRAGAETIVYASSSAVYGSAPDNPVPLREDDPLRPAPFAYPVTKLRIERLLEDLAARHPRTRIVRLRPSWVVGPGARVLLGGRAYVSLADHDPEVQVTWIDDAIAAFSAALHSPSASGAFNLGPEGSVRASEIAGILGVQAIRLPYRVRRAAATASTALRLPGALHPGFVDMDRYPIVVDASRATRELGWRPRYDTRAAFERLRAAIRGEGPAPKPKAAN